MKAFWNERKSIVVESKSPAQPRFSLFAIGRRSHIRFGSLCHRLYCWFSASSGIRFFNFSCSELDEAANVVGLATAYLFSSRHGPSDARFLMRGFPPTTNAVSEMDQFQFSASPYSFTPHCSQQPAQNNAASGEPI